MAQYIKTEEGYKGLEESISIVTDDKMDKTNPVGTGSFSMNRKAGTVIGVNSHAEGNSTTASGDSSHAEGSSTTASKYCSHAEGNGTTASRDYSHAEGNYTTASGEASHAEGCWTTANGYNSHAEGGSTNEFSSIVTETNPTTGDIITAWKTEKFSIAKGDYSHVEGKDNLALGDYSHAEGDCNTASGDHSHAEGRSTKASGFSSHAEGNNTKATSTNDSASITFSPDKGYYTHAEGYGTVAYGRCSHAEGNGTKASGSDSHSEGYGTVAYGTCSHAEGNATTASGTYSHAEGFSTTANGYNSHAEGGSTNQFSSVVTTNRPTTNDIITAWETQKFSVAKGEYSHVEGKDNLALGKDSHAEGISTKASGDYSHAEGISTEASGYSSHAEGSYTTASGSQSHAEGDHTTANGEGSHVQGKYNIEDTSNKYADIIGNGASATARSNAATVDWNGNAWFAGDVYTGSTSGTNKDEGSKKLATEEYVNSSIAAGGADISLGLTSASVGQTIKVKAVDESGKPTAWEAAEMAGDKWELINEITFSESANGCVINTDSNGAAFSLKAVKVECVIQIDESDPFTYIKAKYNNLTVSSNTTTSLKSGQAYFSSGALWMGSAGIMEMHTGVFNNNYNWTYTISKMGFRYNDDWKQNSISQIKIEPNDGGKPLGTGTKIYVYGVRA